jgi:hypothetical protein
MRKSLLLTALCITGTMMLTSCEQIKDFFEEGDGGSTEKVDLNYGLDADFAFEGSFQNSVANGVTIANSNDVSFVEGTKKDTKGIKFNREKNSQLNISKALIGGENWTISFWGKDLYDGSIFHAETADGEQFMSLSVDEGKLRFADNYRYSSDFWNAAKFNSTNINDSQWHHILLTVAYDSISRSKKISLYVDNQYQDQKTFYTGKGGTKLIFGGNMNFSVNATNMSIDNLRIYSSRAINKKEIAALYEKDKPNYIVEVPSFVVPQSLYTYYTFDNNLNDITENKINGFFSGTPVYASGVYGQGSALKIEADNSSKMIVTKSLNGTRKWSICFWTKDITDGHILSMYDKNASTMVSLSKKGYELKFATGTHNNNNPVYFEGFPTFSIPELNDNQWHHIAITCDYTENKARLYVDGVAIDIISETTSNDIGSKFVLGGACEKPALDAASFTIDNLRVYDTRLLSAEEIQALYQAGE